MFSPGAGGVESYPSCYGTRYEYCGWDIVGGSGDIPPMSQGSIQVVPTVAEHFDPKAVYMFGIDPNNPSTNLRFTIAAITAGGRPQFANNKIVADGTGGELLSDVFNRSDNPLMVNSWSVVSTDALGAQLKFDIFNFNASTIRIFITLWGNAMPDWFVQAWQEGQREGKSTYVVKTRPLEIASSYAVVQKDDETKESRALRLLPGFTTRSDTGIQEEVEPVPIKKRRRKRKRGRGPSTYSLRKR